MVSGEVHCEAKMILLRLIFYKIIANQNSVSVRLVRSINIGLAVSTRSGTET